MLVASPSHSPPRNDRPHPRASQAGAAYRSAPPPPPEFTLPLLPPHLEARPKMEGEQGVRGGAEHPGEEQRGVSDAGRLAVDSAAGVLDVARCLAAQDEPTKWYWTFDGDGRPLLARFNPARLASRRPASPPPPAASTGATPASARLLFPPHGNRGFKLRPPTSSSLQPRPAASSSSLPSSSELKLTCCIPPDDELIASQAPRWNAFGRLAPWTSGMTGPLTGQGEEEVGPQAWLGGEDGEVGERRPRRGDRETNDRLRLRIAALQRAGVRSLLTSPPPRHHALPDDAAPLYRRRSSSPLLPPSIDHTLTSLQTTSSLAPTLLQPVLSPLQLLESRTLKHTFRNPHIEALAKTTLDLAESEGQVRKAVGGFWAALEEEDGLRCGRKKLRRKRDEADEVSVETEGVKEDVDAERPFTQPKRPKMRVRSTYSLDIVGAAGSSKGRSKDELNPTFVRLEELFITHEDGGLRIPLTSEESDVDDSATTEKIAASAAAAAAAAAAASKRPKASPVAANDEENGITAESADVGTDVAGIAIADNPSPEIKLAEAETSSATTARKEEPHTTPGAAGLVESQKNESSVPQSLPSPASAQAAMNNDNHSDVAATLEEDTSMILDPNQDTTATAAAASGPLTSFPPPLPPAPAPTSMLLPPSSQREIMLAALSCLTDLESDSREYAARLEEIRGRLAAVAKKRAMVWRALRTWAVKRMEDQVEEEKEERRQRRSHEAVEQEQDLDLDQDQDQGEGEMQAEPAEREHPYPFGVEQ